ncbi:glycosyltransferase family 2 protein [Sphingomonas sp. ASY06-1R]|uniref:glycosyltransferase family 2 protein n=1 Tax=Sphingomonas sp. ASY06-1R TaxID=3445771 RepID=UPI003FA27EFC
MTAFDRSDAPPLVSVLTVCYNARAYVGDCIESVFRLHPELNLEMLVVDNGSDGTENYISAHYPDVRIIPSQGNIGFGAGNNLLARHSRGDYILLLNPDTRFIDDSISRLVAFAQAHPETDAWGGVTLDAELQPEFANRLEFPKLRTMAVYALGIGALMARLRPAAPPSPERHVEVLSGGFMLMSRKAWVALGGFDESFFLYAEEVDLMLRFKRAGFQAMVTDQARVVHDIGGADQLSPQRSMYKTRGDMHFLRKHWGWPMATAGGSLIWIQALRRLTVGAILSGRSKRMSGLAHGFAPIVFRPWIWWNGYRR